MIDIVFMPSRDIGFKDIITTIDSLIDVVCMLEDVKYVYEVYSRGCKKEPSDFGYGACNHWCLRGENIFNKFDTKEHIGWTLYVIV